MRSSARCGKLLDLPELAIAADERRLQPLGAWTRPAAPTRPFSTPERASALPYPSTRTILPPRRPRSARSLAASRRRRTPLPGSATDWTRDAVLTRSPATIPSPTAPTVTAASPVRTPTRARKTFHASSSPSAETAATRSRAARTARSASCSVASGTPDRHHRVADELLDRAAIELDQPPAGLEIAGEQIPHLLRVPRLRNLVKPTRSANSTDTSRRSATGASRGAAIPPLPPAGAPPTTGCPRLVAEAGAGGVDRRTARASGQQGQPHRCRTSRPRGWPLSSSGRRACAEPKASVAFSQAPPHVSISS